METWKYDAIAVGERVRRQRLALKMSQAELAEKIGRSTKYCADIERGSCGMSIDTLMLLCQALNLSPTGLLTGNSMRFSDDHEIIMQIFDCILTCTDEQKKIIYDVVRQFTQRV